MSVHSQSELETRPRPAGMGAGSLLLPHCRSGCNLQPLDSCHRSQVGHQPQPTHPGFWEATNALCCLRSQTSPTEGLSFTWLCSGALVFPLNVSRHSSGHSLQPPATLLVAFPLSHLLEKSCVCSDPHLSCFGTGPTATSPIPRCSSHPEHLILPKQSPAKAGFRGESLCREA